MTTITEFLMARIDEDEKAAREATEGPWERTIDEHGPDETDVGVWSDTANRYPVETLVVGNLNHMADAAHIARHHPARVLSECRAKRSLVDSHSGCDDVSYGDASTCPVVRALASVYADHPDFRQEWRA